jgi:hypothetical protein
MEEIVLIALPLIAKYAPGLIGDFTAALHKAGYTITQIGAIYAQVKPYQELGINPNAPVQPETTPAPKAPSPLSSF